MESRKGLFVVFEGADSSGKTNLSREVSRQASSKLQISLSKINLTSEPSDSVEGQRIRYLLSQGTPSGEFLDLFLKDRKIHVEREILPMLQEGGLVLCDRYKYSTIAYQALQGHTIDELVELNQFFPAPDVTFILYLHDPEEARKRFQREEQSECFDNFRWFWDVQRNYYYMPRIFPKEVFVALDASLTLEELVDQVFEELKRRWEKKCV